MESACTDRFLLRPALNECQPLISCKYFCSLFFFTYYTPWWLGLAWFGFNSRRSIVCRWQMGKYSHCIFWMLMTGSGVEFHRLIIHNCQQVGKTTQWRSVRGICVCLLSLAAIGDCWMENGQIEICAEWNISRTQTAILTIHCLMFTFPLARRTLFDPLAVDRCTQKRILRVRRWHAHKFTGKMKRERTFGGIVAVMCVSERRFFFHRSCVWPLFVSFLSHSLALFVLLVSLKMCYKNSNH